MYSILALAGNKGSGKSAVAEWLQAERGYKIRSFADPLKELGMLLFGPVLTEEICYGPSARREAPFSESAHRQLLMLVRSGTTTLRLDTVHRDLLAKLFPGRTPREVADRFFAVFMQNPAETLRSGRTILQRLGTEWGRELHQDCWVHALAQELAQPGKYVVPDLRFPNEGVMLRAKGAGIFWVDAATRLGSRPVDAHASEPSREDLSFCLSGALENNGSLQDLHALLATRF